MNLLAAPGVRLEARFARTLTGPSEELTLLCRPSLYEVGYRYRTTWQGPGAPCGEDWYAASFPQPVWVDTVGFAHGALFTDGGWWRSFDVEVKRGDGAWQPVTGLRVTPPYDFADTFWEKQPFQPYAVQFDPVQVTALRLIGEPGGRDGYITLAWLGAFHVGDASGAPPWLEPLSPPRLFQLLEPARLWDFLRDFQAVTKLGVFAVPQVYAGNDWPGVEQYLDAARRREYAEATADYAAPEGFLSMVTARTEADRVFSAARAAAFRVSRTGTPELVVHAGNLAHLFAPVVVSGEVLGSLLTWSAVFCDAPDLEWHERWAGELEARGVVSAAAYWRAMRRVPTLSRAQLQASLRMLRLVSGTIADLAEQNLRQAADLERMHQTIGQLKQWRQQVVQQVERYMQAHYADPVRLQDLADHVALSPSYFSQIFREEMGQSPIDRLIDLRIARAKHLLRDEGLGVTEVAGAIGYDSVSYFIRQFSARVGVTPGRWARRADV